MNKKQLIVTMSAVCLMLIITGCSTTSGTPVLEKNAYYQKVGGKQAERDIEQAVSAAKSDLEAVQQKRRNDVQNTSEQAAASVGMGTAAKIVTGKMALGLITGGGTRARTEIKQQSQDKEDFRQNVERRLQGKGYQVKYWQNL